MKILSSIKETQQILLHLKKSGKSIGFVPTMGFLHEGHLELMKHARMENDIVVVSIFVNPLQFGPNEDFDSYPRDIVRDERLAIEQKVDYLFYPSVNEMYPNERTIKLSALKRVNALCGKSREGHFDGVITVVSKLLNIVIPDKAYFGEKDAQQVAIISALVEDLNYPITIVPIQTVREEDGLAKSSRNVYLTEDERKEAPVIFQTLLSAKDRLIAQDTVENVRNYMKQCLEQSTSSQIDYIEILSYPELLSIGDSFKGKVIIAIAIKFTKARLIDNITFDL